MTNLSNSLRDVYGDPGTALSDEPMPAATGETEAFDAPIGREVGHPADGGQPGAHRGSSFDLLAVLSDASLSVAPPDIEASVEVPEGPADHDLSPLWCRGDDDILPARGSRFRRHRS